MQEIVTNNIFIPTPKYGNLNMGFDITKLGCCKKVSKLSRSFNEAPKLKLCFRFIVWL